jgi:hypothetical protein
MTDLAAALEHHRFYLRKLLISWKAWEGTVQVASEQKPTAHMVIPWTAQVHRFGRAFLQLEKIGMEHECHVLVRSALEYAVVGHWAAHVGHNAVVARYGLDQRKLQALVDDLRRTPNDVVPTQWKAEMFTEHIDDTPVLAVDEADVLQNFETVCRDVGVHNNLYPAYRWLCWIAHPTTHSAGVYLGGEDEIALNPTFPRPQGLVGLMAHAVFWSRRTVDDLIVGHPYGDELDQIAVSMDVLTRLPVPKSVQDRAVDATPATVPVEEQSTRSQRDD